MRCKRSAVRASAGRSALPSDRTCREKARKKKDKCCRVENLPFLYNSGPVAAYESSQKQYREQAVG
eukprot:2393274-Rhodomonas_salina.2